MTLNLLTVICLIGIRYIHADIPSHCDPVNDMPGIWTFYVGPIVDRRYNCSSLDIDKTEWEQNLTVTVSIAEGSNSHDVALINGSVVGWWTGMDAEGIDVFANGLHYQAYFNYTEGIDENNKTCYVTNCSQTLGGWVRQDIVHPDEFHCFYGLKKNSDSGIEQICNVYALSDEEMYKDGFRVRNRYQKPEVVEPLSTKIVKNPSLPAEIDWTNYNGLNYVDPVYNQASCGSCFAFGALSALESRFFIQSNRTIDVSLSQQEIVSCSHYSQGCEGGFFPEIGAWAKDHGVTTSKCLPYVQYRPSPSVAVQPACSTRCNVDDAAGVNTNRVVYASNVTYVGGYFGGCTVEGMMEALQDGPITVSVNAGAPEFRNAVPGTIIDSNSTGGTSHTILCVGYGTENGTDYWKIKNSWGTAWGEAGYIRIKRGNNVLRIESKAGILFPGSYTYQAPNTPSDDQSKSLNGTERTLVVVVVVLAIALVIAIITAITLGVLFCNFRRVPEGDYKRYKE